MVASIENIFLLESDEMALIQTVHLKKRLAFAVMLKFFAIESRYPTYQDSISPELISALAQQLNVVSVKFEKFNWNGRSAERFRHEIRQLLGYRKAKKADGLRLIAWLMETVLPQAPTRPLCLKEAYHFFRAHRIEPFKPSSIERDVDSARNQFEKQTFSQIFSGLSEVSKKSLMLLITADENNNEEEEDEDDENKDVLPPKDALKLRHLKKDSAGAKLKHVSHEIDKLNRLRMLELPASAFQGISRKWLKKHYARVMVESPSHLHDYSDIHLYSHMAAFCHIRAQLITDNLTELLIRLVRKMELSAKSFVAKKIISDVQRVDGKFDVLYTLASTAAEHPNSRIKNKIYPKISQEKLKLLAEELRQKKGRWYQQQVQWKMHSLYSHAHRPALLALLKTFAFRTQQKESEPLLKAVRFVIEHAGLKNEYYPDALSVPFEGAIATAWHNSVKEPTEGECYRVNRMNYEVAVLDELCRHLQCKAIWIEGAYRYRNPDEDLPSDFEEKRADYYSQVHLPLAAEDFINPLKEEFHKELQQFNDSLPDNPNVKIIQVKNKTRLRVSPSDAQVEPFNLKKIQREIQQRWPTIPLLDIVKETDLRTQFTQHFHTVGAREAMNKRLLQKRLLLNLYAIGSNVGLKHMAAANDSTTHSELRYVKRRFMTVANVQAAIAEIVNHILAIRDPAIWGEATTGCACDSTQVNSWDQNLMTEWHPRYHARGVMIYWHVDKNSTCIYSQLKTCTSSEVGAMIQGVLKHATKMDMKQAYVDTHGQSTIGFAFSRLLHFDLLARLKNIHRQKLYYSPGMRDHYANLEGILDSSINWKLIQENYDEVVKHIVALKLGMVEPDVLIQRFSRDNYHHPVYKALTEIGKVVKTIFLCRYLSSEALRIETHEALNVVERLNGIMGFIFYGKLGELSTNIKEDQELAVACLHLLQVCMVYINTLMIQEVLSDSKWQTLLTPEDKRALTPLIHAHLNPYGLFPLDMETRVPIEASNDYQELVA